MCTKVFFVHPLIELLSKHLDLLFDVIVAVQSAARPDFRVWDQDLIFLSFDVETILGLYFCESQCQDEIETFFFVSILNVQMRPTPSISLICISGPSGWFLLMYQRYQIQIPDENIGIWYQYEFRILVWISTSVWIFSRLIVWGYQTLILQFVCFLSCTLHHVFYMYFCKYLVTISF